MQEVVGFIGLGNMGRPMALNLVTRGFSLVVHDMNAIIQVLERIAGVQVGGTT